MSQSTSAGLPKRAWVSMRVSQTRLAVSAARRERVLELGLDLLFPAALGGDRGRGRHLPRGDGRRRERLLDGDDVQDRLGLGGRQLGGGQHRFRRPVGPVGPHHDRLEHLPPPLAPAWPPAPTGSTLPRAAGWVSDPEERPDLGHVMGAATTGRVTVPRYCMPKSRPSAGCGDVREAGPGDVERQTVVAPAAERRPERGPGAPGRRSDRRGAVVERPAVRDRVGGDVDHVAVERHGGAGVGQRVTPEARLEVDDAGPVAGPRRRRVDVRAWQRRLLPDRGGVGRSRRERLAGSTRTAARASTPGPPSRGVAVSTTNVPTSVASGGSGASPSSRSAPGRRALQRADLDRRYREHGECRGAARPSPRAPAGTGPANTTHRRAGRGAFPRCRETRPRARRRGVRRRGTCPRRGRRGGADVVGTELATAGGLRGRRRGEPHDAPAARASAARRSRRLILPAAASRWQSTRTGRSPSDPRTPSSVNPISPCTDDRHRVAVGADVDISRSAPASS